MKPHQEMQFTCGIPKIFRLSGIPAKTIGMEFTLSLLSTVISLKIGVKGT